MIKNERLAPKITELFDILEADLGSGDYEHADVILARLSKYFHLFDDEHMDYYHYARDVIDESFDVYDDYDGQPDELQEWYDFDPDC